LTTEKLKMQKNVKKNEVKEHLIPNPKKQLSMNKIICLNANLIIQTVIGPYKKYSNLILLYIITIVVLSINLSITSSTASKKDKK